MYLVPCIELMMFFGKKKVNDVSYKIHMKENV